MALQTSSTLVHLQEATNPFGDPPTVAMSFWFYPTNSGVQFSLGGIGDTGTDFSWAWLSRTSANRMRMYKSTAIYAETLNTVNVNAWNHVYGYSAGNNYREVRLNGGTLYTNTTFTSSGNGSFNCINIIDKLAAWDFAGRLAECGFWAAQLSVDEQLALAAGFSPMMIKPQSLARYWPFQNSRADWRNGSTLSLISGSHGYTSHAKVIRPGLVLPGRAGPQSSTGTAAQTLPSVSQSGSGAVEVSGDSAQTLPRVTQAASGTVESAGVAGTAAQTLPSLTQSAAGAVAIAATCAQTLPALSQASAASVPSNGTAAQTLPSLTQAATGAISVAGQASQTLPAIVQDAAGKAIVGGDGASLLPSIGQSGIAKVLITGTGSQTLPGVRQAAVGGGPLVRVCLRISDQARYSLAIADGARYRVAVSDQARNAVALTDAARYALQTTDSARYDLATSDETC